MTPLLGMASTASIAQEPLISFIPKFSSADKICPEKLQTDEG